MTGEAALGTEIATKVRDFPEVTDLSSGSFGTVSTPVPGGRIEGVALRDDSVQIGVVVRFGRPLPEIAADIRDAVRPLAPGRTVHVSIEDVVAGLPEGGGTDR